ncbi:MAG: nitroreductase/quinone reductase family protein [Hyphomonadaceae bacterium]
MATLKWIQDHIDLYKRDPEKALYWDASLGGGTGMLTTLLLTTTGRKSGKPIPTPLIFDKVDNGYVVIASKGGAPQHPDWFLNMEANPKAEIQAGRDHHHVRMRVAAGAERERLWAHMVKLYAPYEDYQKRTGGREIPVVVLEPVSN